MRAQCAAWERAGRTVVLAGWEGQARGAIAVADTVKPSAAAAAKALRDLRQQRAAAPVRCYRHRPGPVAAGRPGAR